MTDLSRLYWIVESREWRVERHIITLCLISLFIIPTLICEAQTPRKRKEAGMKEAREPAVSGMFFPDRPEILSRDVKKYLENVKREKIDGEVIALVSPHAGYIYSGQVAAHAYKLIEGKTFDSVVVVAPINWTRSSCNILSDLMRRV